MDSIMGKLQAMSDRLSPTDRIIASYFLQNSDRLMGLSMPQIALACQVSKPAIVRLCKKMGFSGYKGLLTALAAEKALRGSAVNGEPQITLQGMDIADICDMSARMAIEIIQDTRRSLSLSDLERAAQMLMSRRSLIVFGWDSALINVQDAQMKFSRLGFRTAIAMDAYSRALLLRALRPGDVVMLFTQRGECADGHLVMDQIHRQGAAALIITTDAQGYELGPDDILFSADMKGHLPGTGDMDHTLGGNFTMSTLYMIVSALMVERGLLPPMGATM